MASSNDDRPPSRNSKFFTAKKEVAQLVEKHSAESKEILRERHDYLSAQEKLRLVEKESAESEEVLRKRHDYLSAQEKLAKIGVQKAGLELEMARRYPSGDKITSSHERKTSQPETGGRALELRGNEKSPEFRNYRDNRDNDRPSDEASRMRVHRARDLSPPGERNGFGSRPAVPLTRVERRRLADLERKDVPPPEKLSFGQGPSLGSRISGPQGVPECRSLMSSNHQRSSSSSQISETHQASETAAAKKTKERAEVIAKTKELEAAAQDKGQGRPWKSNPEALKRVQASEDAVKVKTENPERQSRFFPKSALREVQAKQKDSAKQQDSDDDELVPEVVGRGKIAASREKGQSVIISIPVKKATGTRAQRKTEDQLSQNASTVRVRKMLARQTPAEVVVYKERLREVQRYSYARTECMKTVAYKDGDEAKKAALLAAARDKVTHKTERKKAAAAARLAVSTPTQVQNSELNNEVGSMDVDLPQAAQVPTQAQDSILDNQVLEHPNRTSDKY